YRRLVLWHIKGIFGSSGLRSDINIVEEPVEGEKGMGPHGLGLAQDLVFSVLINIFQGFRPLDYGIGSIHQPIKMDPMGIDARGGPIIPETGPPEQAAI